MQIENRVTKVASALSFLTLALMIAMVLGLAYFFVDTQTGRDIMLPNVHSPDPSTALSDGTLRAMLLVGLLSVAVQFFLMVQARRLFGLYAQGIYLSRDCADAIRAIGAALVALPLVRFVQEPLWSILQTLGSEDISVSIAVSSSGIGFLIGGALMLLVGWTMVEAARIAEENKGFV